MGCPSLSVNEPCCKAKPAPGKPAPGIGFALGLDRTLLACDAENVFHAPAADVSVFVVDVVDGSHAMNVTAALRAAGVSCDRAFDGRSMKAQMKAADRSGARYAVILGGDEVAQGICTVRDLTTSEQYTISRETIVEYFTDVVSSENPRRNPS